MIIATATEAWVQAVRWFDPYINLDVVRAQLYWWFGGVFFAFAMGAFSLIIRATRGAASDVQL